APRRATSTLPGCAWRRRVRAIPIWTCRVQWLYFGCGDIQGGSMSNRVVVVRHGDDPPDDRVYTYLVTNGFEPVVRKPFAGELLGEPDGSIAGTVVHGGK